ncbi:hypothetical protein I4U23_002004 [Adineta vaga]|nr:hypothetical protein I4U23_002004 [Adineta vaga]
MEYYQTTTQSLSRLDLEASYQAFIRGQIAQKSCDRDELEQFVRNDSDIKDVNYYLNSSHHTSPSASYPLQAHLLFHSSKLNEQKANLIKSASSNKTLKQLNENLHLRQYFPETYISDSRCSYKEKDSSVNQPIHHQSRSMHVEHGEKKYHITFLKDANAHAKLSLNSTNDLNLPKTSGLLSDRDSQSKTDVSTVSDVHRESFPPLSLSALEECRPTLTPRSLLTTSIRTQKQKRDFIWEQSIVSSKHE